MALIYMINKWFKSIINSIMPWSQLSKKSLWYKNYITVEKLITYALSECCVDMKFKIKILEVLDRKYLDQ